MTDSNALAQSPSSGLHGATLGGVALAAFGQTMQAVNDNPVMAAPEPLRPLILAFWELVDEFLETPKAIAVLINHWVHNKGLMVEDAATILDEMSGPEAMAEIGSKWQLLNELAKRAQAAKLLRRQQAFAAEQRRRYSGQQNSPRENYVPLGPVMQAAMRKAGAA